MANFTFKAETRNTLGTGASRRLRKKEQLPAIIYGGEMEAVLITLRHDDLYHASEKAGFFDAILEINIDGKAEKVMIKDLQRHPFKPLLTHADFIRV